MNTKFTLKFAVALTFLALCLSCKQTKKKQQLSGNQKTTQKNNEIKTVSGFPQPDHIVIVIEENHGFDQIINSPKAPFMNKLAKEGALFTDSHGVIHPSQPNYLALFSGAIQGVKDDHCLAKETPYTTPNLGAALFEKGFTFAGYAQNMPKVNFKGCNHKKSELNHGNLYARKHCPWVNWVGTKKNNFSGGSTSFPMTKFPSDFTKLPTVSFVIPDQDHDMHNGAGSAMMIKKADDWLQSNLSDYIEWAKSHNSLFILTYDEDDFTKDNRIATIFAGQMVKQGKYNEHINHYNLLRTIEKMYDLKKSGPPKEEAITDVWK